MRRLAGYKSDPYLLRRIRPWLIRWVHPKHGGQTRSRHRTREEAERRLELVRATARRPARYRLVHVSNLKGF